MTRICILQFAHLGSTRIPLKMLQEVGGRRLIDRGLDYMRQLGHQTGAVPILAAHPRDAALIEAARRYEVEWMPLDDRADAAESWPTLIGPLCGRLMSRFDWIWDANLCCHPFLRLRTGRAIIGRMESTSEPFTVVTEKRGVVWDQDDRVILGAGELANTRRNPVYRELAHLAYCWTRAALPWPEAELARVVRPFPLELDWMERLDIDTPDDLDFARLVAQTRQIDFDR